MDDTHCRNHLSARTFGLISEDINGLNSQNNGRLNQELRRSNIYSSVIQRPFGLFGDDSRVSQNSNVPSRGSYLKMSTVSKASENVIDSEGFNHHLERNGNINSSLMSKRFGLQSRNLTSYSGLFPERSFRLSQDPNYRSHNISMILKPFSHAAGNNTLTTELEAQDRMTYNGRFRRPTLSRVIRGRNSTLSSRFLQGQRHCKDFSNISSINVSCMPQREGDTLSESRFALNTRSNWMDNQSVASSFMSVASIKSQFMTVFESLHSSILNIGPRLTAEAVRAEIERAKQKLEIISERSFAHSVKDTGETSVISQPSKYICPVNEPSILSTIDGGSLHLKSSKDLLKTLMSSKDQFEACTHTEKEEKKRSSFDNKKPEYEDASAGVFKKPRPLTNKGSGSMKVKTAHAAKKITSGATGEVINLHQWYPIAIGLDLALCGVNEEGAFVKTEAIKKRLNSRRVELSNGVNCNLIGSPAFMISELPKKITALMKNGLTERWRVLQRELLSCQTAETEKRISRSLSAKNSPEEKNRVQKSREAKNSPKKKKVCGSPKARNSSEKKKRISGNREVKSLPDKKKKTFGNLKAKSLPEVKKRFSGSPRALSSPEKKKKVLESPKAKGSPEKKSRISGSPKARSSPKKKKRFSRTPRKAETSPKKKNKTIPERKPNSKRTEVISMPVKKGAVSEVQTRSGRTVKPPSMFWLITSGNSEMISAKNPKERKEEREGKEIKVQLSSEDDAKRQDKTPQAQSERKRKVAGDWDSVQSKKCKVEKKTKVEVEVRVEVGEQVMKKGKKKRSKPLTTRSPKPVKSPSVQKEGRPAKNKTVKSTLETKKETEGMVESEEDFEFSLDDIHVPEVARLSENPLLSRSQFRLAAMETPPLKYFNSNLNLLRSATPVRSPDWYISQRTESEARKFQKRREEAFKKTKVDVKKTVIEKTKNVQSKDLKRMMEWMTEKTIRSPQWNSKVLQYIIPSRKQMELEDDEDEDVETELP